MLPDQTIPAKPEGVFPARLTLAMAYVPYQCWEEPAEAAEALAQGTVFPSLVKPFMAGKGGNGNGDAVAVFGQNGKG